MNYKYLTGHNTFYLREGWLKKGLFEVQRNPEIFQANNLIKAIDSLGIGSNMVTSLKYWLLYFELIEKDSDHKYKMSKFADMIISMDNYLNKNGTLWLLHLRSSNNSSIWKIMFQEMEIAKFSKEQVFDRVIIRLKEDDKKFADKTIRNAVNIFINTYYHENNKDPEDNIYSPLSKLRLIVKDIDNHFKFRNIPANEIPIYLIYYIIFTKDDKIILKRAFEIINRYIRIDMNNLKKNLRQLEKRKFISIDRAAGLNNISKRRDFNDDEIFDLIINGDSSE
ncbi:MAG: DUF4007 family protein [Candidatus Cloacimonetes bacterium]|nr:DUF4007 family protein [Candidatus Cloacimonadota bacterium]